MAKQETIAHHTMVLVSFFVARSYFIILTWHQFLHATWNNSRSRNQPSTRYFQSGPRVGTPELSCFVPFGQSTQSLSEKWTTKQAHGDEGDNTTNGSLTNPGSYSFNPWFLSSNQVFLYPFFNLATT